MTSVILGCAMAHAVPVAAWSSKNFNRDAAVAWAYQHALGDERHPYEKFDANKSNSCTLFVSNAFSFLGGGMPMNDSWYMVDRWWEPKYHRVWSNSYTVATTFRDYMSGARYATLESADASSGTNPAWHGDAIWWDWGNGYQHTMIEDQYGQSSDNYGGYTGDQIDQWTTDRRQSRWNWGWLDAMRHHRQSDAKRMRTQIIHMNSY